MAPPVARPVIDVKIKLYVRILDDTNNLYDFLEIAITLFVQDYYANHSASF